MAIGGISWLAVPAHAASLWIRLARKGIWGIILLLAAHARSARGYDDQEACRFHVVNETTGLYVSHYFMCKAPFPPYCCGTDTFKECCRWTHYVINRFGGGSTGLGVGLLVGLGFLTAFVIFLLVCLVFRCCVVSRWNQASERSTSTPQKRLHDNVAM
ncbi:uncharacterized protein LOC129602714 isoform X2 [Paramacrobiotus metropolitanus]|uniref:uncharacterized protein LOC129602714 isoform X2 n=1 Tax=Paramacrobiotus metropolitanus TaxID=2943436 RepID=UPI002445B7DB|nr:uncharacterized protein LOC129602714 isoform X2 [Paramacrobiotus metropolitanus]